MAKLSFNEISAAIQESEEANRFLGHINNHPYWGLRDERGWLSRFPVQTPEDSGRNAETVINPMLSREWVQEYINAGGKFDSQQIYGISPYDHKLEQFSPVQVAGWLLAAHNQRWDNVPSIYWLQKFVTISETATLSDLYRMIKGANLVQECLTWGFNPLEEGKSIFWCSRKYQKLIIKHTNYWYEFDYNNIRVLSFMLENAKQCPKDIAQVVGQLCSNGTIKELEEFASSTKNRLGRTLALSILKGRKRLNIRNSIPNRKTFMWNRSYNTLPVSEKAFIWACSKNMVWHNEFGVVNTTEGYAYYTSKHPSILRFQRKKKGIYDVGKYEVYKTREVAGVWVCKVGSTCFAWKESFSNHAEGATVKEAIDLLLNRVGIHTDKVSFNMVRKAKGFCLAGTRSWLLDTMPHLGNILRPYNTWGDVPAELMNHVWEFTSRDVFRGRLD